ncbi:hypothetical protein HIM_07201 [Hirsutella minnesotensis 3608]|uniref:O-methyltransferase C-terminal domain-containing protein n=1 Tax=Hirsutella minnesotensis 3608 TaxID=1043627 RepID=A0A0F7ZZ10_9HYPO|nr:hypothetical protein HIM_07201 [Hirsutella minnesotensis 3608]
MSRHKYQIPDDPSQAAFCEAFQTDLTLYEYYHTVDINRGQRFSRAMAGHYDGQLDRPIESIFPFQDLPDGSLVVDIGGGNGQQAIRLASRCPQLRFVVQDHDNVVTAAVTSVAAKLPESVANRISWEAHSYFAQQPRREASVYLLSHVLMDNTNDNCALILRAIVDAMGPASRLLIHDFLDTEEDIGHGRSRMFDLLDLHMIASVSRPSRNQAEWDALIETGGEGHLVRHKTWPFRDGAAVIELRLASNGTA